MTLANGGFGSRREEGRRVGSSSPPRDRAPFFGPDSEVSVSQCGLVAACTRNHVYSQSEIDYSLHSCPRLHLEEVQIGPDLNSTHVGPKQPKRRRWSRLSSETLTGRNTRSKWPDTRQPHGYRAPIVRHLVRVLPVFALQSSQHSGHTRVVDRRKTGSLDR